MPRRPAGQPRQRAPRGTGSIRFVEARQMWRWEQDFGKAADGKRDRHSREAASYDDVIAKRDAYLAERRAKHLAAPSSSNVAAAGTVASFFARWLRATVLDTMAPATYTKYETQTRLVIVPQLGDLLMAAVTTDDVVRALDTCGGKAATRTAAWTTLASGWRTAYEQGMVADRDVVFRAKAARDPRRNDRATTREESRRRKMDRLAAIGDPEQRAALEADDMKAVLRHLEGERLRALFVLAAVRGPRPEELLGLAWPHLRPPLRDGGPHRLLITDARTRDHWAHGCAASSPCHRAVPASRCPDRRWLDNEKGTKTAGGVRTLFLGPGLVGLLDDWRARQALELAPLAALPEVPYVFTDPDGRELSHGQLRYAWDKAQREAGLTRRYSLYSLRHTAASELASDPTTSTPDLMASMGWTKPATAGIYLHGRSDRVETVQLASERRVLGG